MDKRRQQRYEFHKTGTVYWLTADGRFSCVANCFEASIHGLSAETPKFLPVGTKATIYLDGLEEGIEAKVRHCRKIRFWYRIGFQLVEPMPLALREKWIEESCNSQSPLARWQPTLPPSTRARRAPSI